MGKCKMIWKEGKGEGDHGAGDRMDVNEFHFLIVLSTLLPLLLPHFSPSFFSFSLSLPLYLPLVLSSILPIPILSLLEFFPPCLIAFPTVESVKRSIVETLNQVYKEWSEWVKEQRNKERKDRRGRKEEMKGESRSFLFFHDHPRIHILLPFLSFSSIPYSFVPMIFILFSSLFICFPSFIEGKNLFSLTYFSSTQ